MKYITLLFFSLLAFSHSASAFTSYPEKVKCPIDGKKFEIMVCGSYTTTNGEKDFEVHGFIGNMYEIQINSCPKCHYCGYKSDFDTSFNDTTKTGISKILAQYKKTKMTDALENEIAAKIHIYLKDNNDNIASIYLVGSYLLKYDSLGIDKRKEFQKACIKYLLKAIETKEYKENERYPTIYYLVGELYRRTGNFEKAVYYFNTALQDDSIKENIKKMALEQKELAINKNEKNGWDTF